MSRGSVSRCPLVVLVGLASVFALVAVAGPAAATPATENASLGADISSFMQASSVETADDVEGGQFQAALTRTEDSEERHALIESRLARLEARSERLRFQRETLGETPDVRNRSIATRISVGATELERSVNATERRANEAGVATERLSALRETARTIPGPAVAELARGVSPPPNAGPPDGSPARDDDQPRPDALGPPNVTSAPTDARDAERVGPPGGNGADSGSPSSGSAGGGAGPPDGAADDTPGAGPSSDDPTAPDADPDDERDGDPGSDGDSGAPLERGSGDPPTDGSSSDSAAESAGSNGRPTSPGDGAGAPPDSRDT
ncbi:MAG: hypothetical protein RI568_12115 [Natronomonas sp.]|uniref:hypothetical protein n=1 Tax=Natronomonas sp. TaxID=2184060 RepID=UPI0028703D30|nr:hypothetical protein [Natronomonas sp.]MDR9431426.1 hypothetical protein [Natronomonas sp.]